MNDKILNATIKARYAMDTDTVQKLISHLMSKAQVLAPQKKGENSFAYLPVAQAADVVLDYPRTIQPLKKFFLPPTETLLTYQRSKNTCEIIEEEITPRIFFGVHSYDMQGLKRLDYSFSSGNPESNYLRRREECLFIGISYKGDKHHFGPAVGIDVEEIDGFCLYLKKYEGYYECWVVNDQGKELLDDFPYELTPSDEPYHSANGTTAKIKVHYNRLPQIFEHVYHSGVWEKVAERCVGCGTCNLLCSTCYCFDVRDEVELDTDHGQRQRFWDGCMLNRFAEVAGGEDFRDKLHLRTRHRLFRKFKYITDKSSDIHCVGCGRCSKYCPADINLVEIINALVDDYNKSQTQKTYQA